MSGSAKRVAVLGSTGSIGKSTLEVIAASEGRLEAVALSAHTSVELLYRQAGEFRPRWIVLTDAAAFEARPETPLPRDTHLLRGCEGVEWLVGREEVNVVVAAIVGSAGLSSTWAALEAGKTVALANKETLVMAGPLVMDLAAERGGRILPVDSEHSAVFQAIQAGRREDVAKVILTASGGPFRTWSAAEMANVTVEQALNHPTWDMGPKITVDSATMMNKALEIIEARWLFDLLPNQIEVVIHPQSIVHSMVEFADGSVIAQMSPPDMKLPIQYALTWPERRPSIAARFDWSDPARLDFEPPDFERFPALELGLEVAKSGGTAGAVLNAANEAAVGSFLAGEMSFSEIVPACRSALEHHNHSGRPTLGELIELDRWAREEVARWVCS